MAPAAMQTAMPMPVLPPRAPKVAPITTPPRMPQISLRVMPLLPAVQDRNAAAPRQFRMPPPQEGDAEAIPPNRQPNPPCPREPAGRGFRSDGSRGRG